MQKLEKGNNKNMRSGVTDKLIGMLIGEQKKLSL